MVWYEEWKLNGMLCDLYDVIWNVNIMVLDLIVFICLNLCCKKIGWIDWIICIILKWLCLCYMFFIEKLFLFVYIGLKCNVKYVINYRKNIYSYVC